MLDDKDTFRTDNRYAGLFLVETQGLIEILKTSNLKPSRLSWFLFLRNFMVKHSKEIDLGIAEKLELENVPE